MVIKFSGHVAFFGGLVALLCGLVALSPCLVAMWLSGGFMALFCGIIAFFVASWPCLMFAWQNCPNNCILHCNLYILDSILNDMM